MKMIEVNRGFTDVTSEQLNFEHKIAQEIN